jgi:uncharacterized membrane protein (DUF2068 family)
MFIQTPGPRRRIDRRETRAMRSTTFLPWIVAFKAFKTVMLTALGITLLSTRNVDPNDLLMRFALAVHLPLTSRVFVRALVFANGLTTAKQTALAVTACGYAVLMGTEGVALYLRKPWARWLTIVATSSLIPLELYEITREVHPIRVLVVIVNVAIVVYLWNHEELFVPQERPVTVLKHHAAR